MLEIFFIIEPNFIEDSLELGEYLLLTLSDEYNLESHISLISGSMKIGEVVGVFPELSSELFEMIDFYYPKNFTIYTSAQNPELSKSFELLAKEFIKDKKLKGQIIDTRTDIFKATSHVRKEPDKNIEIQIYEFNGQLLISKVIHYSNSSEFKKLDTKRAGRKFTHGTSPRLVRIMMNILNPQPGETIVDPFCGSGTFLLEALRRNVNVVGIDNAQHLIQISTENIKALDSTAKAKLICKDSGIANFNADHVIFEPYMGEFMSELPTQKTARNTITELHRLYIRIFKNMHEHTSVNSRMVCVLPFIKSSDNKINEIPKDLFRQTGYKLSELNFPIEIPNPIEYAAPDGSNIGRRIYIVEKKKETN